MGNAAMCKVCGSDKGLRTVSSQVNLDQNALPDYYCVEHFPAQPPLMLVRAHTGRCSRQFQATGTLPEVLFLWYFGRCFADEVLRNSFKQNLWKPVSALTFKLFLFCSQSEWQGCFFFLFFMYLSLTGCSTCTCSLVVHIRYLSSFSSECKCEVLWTK